MPDWQRSYLWLPIVGMTAQFVESACLLATAMTHCDTHTLDLLK